MKKYNVLVLAMSTLSDPLTKCPFNNIYVSEENPDGTQYHAIGQLEPVPQFLMDTYGEITHYLVLATPQVQEPLGFNWENINQKIRDTGIGGEIKLCDGEYISAVKFFQKRIEAFHEEKKFATPKFESIEIFENEMGKGLEDLLEKVQALYKECLTENPGTDPDDCWNMFVDIHGGLRAASFATFTLIQILKAPDMDDEKDMMQQSGESYEQYISRLTDGKPTIPVTGIYTINYDDTNKELSYIVNVTRLYEIYARESIEAYMNYGQYAQIALRSRVNPYAENIEPYAFISYRRADAPKERFTFIGTLKKAGLRYWYDDSIPLLEDWMRTLEKAIYSSKIFIALISKNYYKSYQCLKEMRQAIDCGKTIFLFSLDKTKLYLPDIGADGNITADDDNGRQIKIESEEMEEILTKNHSLLEGIMIDDIYQPSALVDKLKTNSDFKDLFS